MIDAAIEEWRPVPGWEGLYEVSDLGRVRSLDREARCGNHWGTYRGRILKPLWNKHYHQVHLCRDGVRTTRQIHQLMALAFIGPRPAGQVCRHLNCQSTDNRPENLAYGTPRDNVHDSIRAGKRAGGERNPSAKLTEADVRELRSLWDSGVANQATLARNFGIDRATCRRICNRRTWRGVEPALDLPALEAVLASALQEGSPA